MSALLDKIDSILKRKKTTKLVNRLLEQEHITAKEASLLLDRSYLHIHVVNNAEMSSGSKLVDIGSEEVNRPTWNK